MIALPNEFVEEETPAIIDDTPVVTCAMLQPEDILVFESARKDMVTCMVAEVDEVHIYVWQHAVSSLPFCYPRAWFDAQLAGGRAQHYTGRAAQLAWDRALGAWLRGGRR